jgi:hypothetical protein
MTTKSTLQKIVKGILPTREEIKVKQENGINNSPL